MRFTSPSRRAAGLLAVTTIGLSTALLSATGIASAETPFVPDGTPFTFTTVENGDADVWGAALEIPQDYCSVTWEINGGSGGQDSDGAPGNKGGHVEVTTGVMPTATYSLAAGGKGGDAVATADEVVGEAGAGGANGYDEEVAGQLGVVDVGADYFGGGGGAGSTVSVFGEDGPELLVGAFGGDGAGAVADAGQGYGDEVNSDDSTTAADLAGDGVISGTVYPCDEGNGGGTDEGDGAGTGDGTGTGNPDLGTTNPGTTNPGTTTPDLATTGGTAPAPATAALNAGVQSLTFTWTAPADTNGLTGYSMEAYLQPSDTIADEDIPVDTKSVLSCEAPAGDTSCTVLAAAGFSYKGHIDAVYADDYGVSDVLTSGVVSAPSAPSATLPKADGTLTSNDADGKVVAGDKITISGKDFLPGSTVDLVVYSTPVKLGTATVLADGTFSATVVLPKELANGTHHLVASGVDANGNPRNLVVEVTVSGGTAVLAFTGFSALPFVGAGALALIAGGGLLVVSRRRQAA